MATSAGGVGKTTAELMAQLTYSGWDFSSTSTGKWWMSEGNTRPFLRMEYGTTIVNAHQLQLMALGLGASYTLANNIDMGELTLASGMWNIGMGFVPVGNGAPFTGVFDGLGHTIRGLTIIRPTRDYVGLFGWTAGGSTLRNVGLVDGSMTGRHHVGGLVGLMNISFGSSNSISNSYNTSAVTGTSNVGGLVGYNQNNNPISNSYSTGAVNGTTEVGGLVGANHGTISNSYSISVVNGTSNVGGLVGWNNNPLSNSYSSSSVKGTESVGGLVGVNYGQISNSYSVGTVTGMNNAGGLVGENSALGHVTASFWNTTTSGQIHSAGSADTYGKTNSDMKKLSTFKDAGWDIDTTTGTTGTIWRIVEGTSYHLLSPNS